MQGFAGSVRPNSPEPIYTNTWAAIMALISVPEGAVAYGTDVRQFAVYSGGAWRWESKLLAATYYTGGNKSTTSATLVDVDATNLAATFITPASGRVLVRLTAQSNPGGGVVAGCQHQWGVRSGTSNIAGPHTVARDIVGNGSAALAEASVAFPLAGDHVGTLVPGQSYTFKWAHAAVGGGTVTIGASSSSGPAVMEVWALP